MWLLCPCRSAVTSGVPLVGCCVLFLTVQPWVGMVVVGGVYLVWADVCAPCRCCARCMSSFRRWSCLVAMWVCCFAANWCPSRPGCACAVSPPPWARRSAATLLGARGWHEKRHAQGRCYHKPRMLQKDVVSIECMRKTVSKQSGYEPRACVCLGSWHKGHDVGRQAYGSRKQCMVKVVFTAH